MNVTAEQRGNGLAAAVELHVVVLDSRRLGQYGQRHGVGGTPGGEVISFRRLRLGVLYEFGDALPGGITLHEEYEVVQHDVHDRLDFRQRFGARIGDGRDLRRAVDQYECVRI